MATNQQTKPTDFGCESICRLLPSTSTIAIYYYYLARKLTLILSFHGGWKAELTKALQQGYAAHTQGRSVYHSGCRDKRNCPQSDSNLGPLTPQSTVLPVDHCDLQ